MKILFFSNDFPGPHRPTRAVFNLKMCQALATRHDVRVVSPVPWMDKYTSANDPSLQSQTTLDVDYRTYYYPPRVLLAQRGRFMWWSLRRHLLSVTRSWKPDVCLAYWAHPDGEAALRWRAETGIPVVQIVGGSDVLVFRDIPGRRACVQRVLKSANAVVAIGQHLANEVIALGAPSERVFGMYRPVDVECFSPGSRSEARRSLCLAENERIVVWVGRFHKIKGLEHLVDALVPLRSAVPSARVCLVGEGSELEAIRARAQSAGVAEAIRFVGPKRHSELVHWYRAADATVLPSLSEGVPNVLLESIACGTPFVASRVGGIPEIADPSLDRLVPPGDAAALAAALTEVLTRPASGARAVMPGSPDAFASQLETVIATAMTTSPIPAVA